MKIACCLVFLLGLSQLLVGQDAPETVSFDFRCLAMSKDLRLMELYMGAAEDAGRLRIRLNDSSKTEAYSYSGPPLVYFYDQETGGSVMATYRYNPEQEEPLLLFIPNSTGASPALSILSIEDSWSQVEPMSCLLVNLASKPLYWKFGEERFKIQPKDKRLIKVDKDQAQTPVIALEIDQDGNPYRVYRGQWVNIKNMRRLIFVRDTKENEGGSIRVKVIEDFYVPDS